MLNKNVLKAFTATVLSHRFDNPQPIPKFHEELWEMCTSSDKYVAIAAPRGHAKSTSVTHAYTLASVLFREKSFVVLIANTESQVVAFLQDIKLELQENEELQELFGLNPELVKSRETELIGEFDDGSQFRILAKSSGSEIRGTKWRNKRPDLIICDDLEDTETVYNEDRRNKFRNWFYADVLPSISDTGCVRVVGTVLHMDSLLERLLQDPNWRTERYRAHSSDFSELLWPEKFSKEKLETIRNMYIRQGNPEKYAQEYLNDPIENDAAYFRKEDFIDLNSYPEMLSGNKVRYMAVDFAISQKTRSDYTAIVIVGVNETGHLIVEDVRKGRWDGKEIIDEIFNSYQAWSPELVLLEEGIIRHALGPFLMEEMGRRGIYIPVEKIKPSNDKLVRGRSFQSRMRARTVLFDKEASWYPSLELTMRRFPFDTHDDEVDALSLIGLYLQHIVTANSLEQDEEEQYMRSVKLTYRARSGRSKWTGY